MHYRHLFSSRRQSERGDLCRLQTLAAAARLGTVWLHGDAVDPVLPDGTLPHARNHRGGASCRYTPEHYHG